jgi:hypothetical protein
MVEGENPGPAGVHDEMPEPLDRVSAGIACADDGCHSRSRRRLVGRDGQRADAGVDVRMHVDQPGDHDLPARVDDDRARVRRVLADRAPDPCREIGLHHCDAAELDSDVQLLVDLVAGVDHAAAANDEIQRLSVELVHFSLLPVVAFAAAPAGSACLIQSSASSGARP